MIKLADHPAKTPERQRVALTTSSTGRTVCGMDYREHIVLDPDVRFGKPIIRGTRIAVADVLSYLASGMSEDDLLSDFPQLSRDDIRACLAYAAERERRLAGGSSE